MRKWSALAASAALLLSACATNPPQPTVTASSDLNTALKEAAQRAVEVRVRLAAMQPVPLLDGTPGNVQPVPPEALAQSNARIDVDFVGDAEKATRLISRILGWEVTVAGKKRADVVVSLRHHNMDGITIFQDIGAQCGHRCDIHVELVEAGKSSVGLTYRD